MENALNNAEQAVKNRKLTYDFDLWWIIKLRKNYPPRIHELKIIIDALHIKWKLEMKINKIIVD
jgi:hypothetical protein